MGVIITEGTQTTIKTTTDAAAEIQHIRVDGGTLTAGSLANIGIVHNAGTVATGSLANVGVVHNAGTLANGSLANLGVVHNAGTLATGSLANLAQVHNAGTLQAGTVQLNPVPVPTLLIQGTQGTAGGSLFGTLSAASGAGTKHYVSGVSIVVESGTADVRVLAGTAIQGTGVLCAGKFPPGGGIREEFNPAFSTGTNSELTYHFVGAGTAFIVVNYWKGA